MSKTRPNIVQILDSPPGGARYTTRKSAVQFVRRGLAVFEADAEAIRFLNQDRQTNSARVCDGIGGEYW